MTFGHGRLDGERIGELLTSAEVALLVDVRRFPGSRSNPAAARGAIPDLCAQIGIAYRWDERLGGRRHLRVDELRASPDSWWRVDAFRAYAAWTRSAEFRDGFAELLTDIARQPSAIMCSESVWWRCHRRMIADVLTLEAGIKVRHLMHDGSLVEHRPSEGARIGDDGYLIWDGAASHA